MGTTYKSEIPTPKSETNLNDRNTQFQKISLQSVSKEVLILSISYNPAKFVLTLTCQIGKNEANEIYRLMFSKVERFLYLKEVCFL